MLILSEILCQASPEFIALQTVQLETRWAEPRMTLPSWTVAGAALESVCDCLQHCSTLRPAILILLRPDCLSQFDLLCWLAIEYLTHLLNQGQSRVQFQLWFC